MRVKGKKPATLNNFQFPLDILIIFGRVIYQIKTVSHTKKITVLCLLFDIYEQICRRYMLKDFENASPRLKPLLHKPSQCQRDNCYCIS